MSKSRTTEYQQGWNDALAEILSLLQRDPPSRVGEAIFTQRVRNLRRDENGQYPSTSAGVIRAD